jgi:hypothetical protein
MDISKINYRRIKNMKQMNVTSQIWLAALFVAVVLVAGFTIIGTNNLNEDKVADIVNSINVPTAAEIAKLIVLPNTTIVVPADEKVNALWEDLYSDEIEELENASTADATVELEKDDYELLEDWLVLSIADFDKIKNVNIKDVEAKVIELGLNDDEDKTASVVFELVIKYKITEGPIDDVYKKTVFATADVKYDEGDFDEGKVNFTFSF